MAPTSRRTARAVCVLAVLIGLFGMHGLAATQVTGCHGDTGLAAAAPVLAASMTVQPVGHMAAAPRMADTMAGSCCLFVSPTAWSLLALTLLGVIAAAVAPGVGRRWAAGFSGRSPPCSGVSLLRWVCVSRT